MESRLTSSAQLNVARKALRMAFEAQFTVSACSKVQQTILRKKLAGSALRPSVTLTRSYGLPMAFLQRRTSWYEADIICRPPLECRSWS